MVQASNRSGHDMIQVKSVEISRFRGILKGSVGEFTDVNVLVGRNNSGKSSILEAIHRVAFRVTQGPGDPLQRGISIWQRVRSEQVLNPPELWYKLDQSESVLINLTLAVPESRIREKLVLGIRAGDAEPTLNRFSTSHPQNICEDIAQFLRRLTVFRPEDARDPQIERTTWKLVIGSRSDKALSKSLNTIFGQTAESYSMLEGRLWVMFPEYSVPLESQGEGNRAALRCLLLTSVLRKTLFITEEIECHQHPSSLEGFAKALCQQAREQEVQIFLSTHSADCVRAFLTASKEAGSEAAVFHLNLTEGVLDATRLEPDATQTLLDTGVDVRFLDLYG
jgi:hypothetical protein